MATEPTTTAPELSFTMITIASSGLGNGDVLGITFGVIFAAVAMVACVVCTCLCCKRLKRRKELMKAAQVSSFLIGAS